MCSLANVHIHPHADFPLSLGSQEQEAPPQTSTCSQFTRTACGWASKLRLDQRPAASCSAGAQAGPSPEGSVDPTLTPTSGFDSALALQTNNNEYLLNAFLWARNCVKYINGHDLIYLVFIKRKESSTLNSPILQMRKQRFEEVSLPKVM